MQIEQLEQKLGCSWPAIKRAKDTTRSRRKILEAAFEGRVASDTSVVLFGSIAREEMTSGSDADWILLVDGQAYPDHENQKLDLARKLDENGFGEPGRSGVFGCMVGSHSLVHEIGGEDDTNTNTTRRVLLLLESFPVGDKSAFTRVRRQILNRYVRDDRGLMYSTGHRRVPRFLLNDLTRYWRTVTVDFVYKQRSDAGRKWALRNAKLRMSRKLVFASGLLRCFLCQLDEEAEGARKALISNQDPTQMLAYMESELELTPLELLARTVSRPKISDDVGRKLFNSYNSFLALLDDETSRKDLGELKPEDINSSAVWKEVRNMSRDFNEGLRELFFGNDEELRELTIEYGVF
jgi:predicted nucleotidyltransferase